jgi:hypothetical protein
MGRSAFGNIKTKAFDVPVAIPGPIAALLTDLLFLLLVLLTKSTHERSQWEKSLALFFASSVDRFSGLVDAYIIAILPNPPGVFGPDG